MTLTLTFQGRSRSKVMVSLDSPYMVSYWWLVSNISPNFAPLRDMTLWNLIDLEFDFSKSFYVKYDGAIYLPIYNSPLVSNSNYTSISHRLAVIAAQKICSYLLTLEPNFDSPPTPHHHTHPYPGAIFLKPNHFMSVSEGRLPTKMKLIGQIVFEISC